MKVSQLLATILTATMLVCLLPTMALAADESGIQLGTAGLGADDTVYFGAYNGETVPWYVLSIDSTAQSGFLLSEYLLGTSAFRSNDFGYYSGSTLQGYMDTNTNSLYNTIFPAVAAGQTMAERNAILAADIPCNDFDAASPSVTGAHLYPLSYTEANDIGWGNSKLQAKSINDKGGWPGWWWLRSSNNDNNALCVDGGGDNNNNHVKKGWGARPASPRLPDAYSKRSTPVRGAKESDPLPHQRHGKSVACGEEKHMPSEKRTQTGRTMKARLAECFRSFGEGGRAYA